MGATPAAGPFPLGSWVTFAHAQRSVRAQVIEDRGPLAPSGPRVYAVRIDDPDVEPQVLDRAEDALEPAEPDWGPVFAYLAGNLVKILEHGRQGGRPKVWLSFGPQGQLTLTYQAERGWLGGAKIPFGAVEHGALFAPMKESVLKFLQGFGLSADDAERLYVRVASTPS